MKHLAEQAELFGLVWQPRAHPFRLRVDDLIRFDGRLGRIIRVTDCAAVVLMNQRRREFCTRFDKPVSFQPPPVIIRIAVNSEIEVLNRKPEPRKTRRSA